MSGLANLKGTDETQTLVSQWDIGATGAHTKTANVPGTGFASVARTAAGKYTVTFARGQVPIGGLVNLQLTEWSAADAAPKNLKPTLSSYTPETAAAAATVKYESWSVGTTPAQIELVNGSKVTLTAVFLKTR